MDDRARRGWVCVVACFVPWSVAFGVTERDALPARAYVTEVLFNVPREDPDDVAASDADRDGARNAVGDEFVEIWNPGPGEVELTGYQLVSRRAFHAEDAEAKAGVRFVFPEFELPAGEVVVVFNGYRSRPVGEVGGERRGPREGNAAFSGAWVFRMSMNSRSRSFANDGDFVLLLDAEGEPVEGVVWGDPDLGPPADREVDEDGEVVEVYALHRVGKNPRGSVQREIDRKGRLTGFEAHVRLRPEAELPFSPGVIPEQPAEDAGENEGDESEAEGG